VLVDRIHKELTDEEIARIAGTYHAWRGEPDAGAYEDALGYCASATVAEVADQRFALTPGRYVGSEEAMDDGEPIQEKIERLKGELLGAFDESDRLQARVRSALERLGV
jgi:type I restriction enzyme M protein